MLLSKSCVYGIRAVIFLALKENSSVVSIREISSELNISFHFLTKVLQKLTEAGLVVSQRGASGGVRLTRSADNITLMEIIVAIDGTQIFETCVLGLPGCGVLKPCPFHDNWSEVNTRLKEMFNNATLSGYAEMVRTGEVRITEINNPDLLQD